LEPLGGFKQQRRSIPPPVHQKRQLPAPQVHLSAVELVQRSRFRKGQQCQRLVGRPRGHLCLSGGERAPPALDRIGRQSDSARQQRGSGRHPPTSACPVSRAFQLTGHLL